MKIVSRDELSKMPNGTLYCGFEPDYLDMQLEVITGHHEADNGWDHAGFNSTLPLTPNLDDTCDKKRITNWCTTDTHDFDFNKDDLFAVFSKTEIRAMITVLQYALSNCDFNINKFMDTYYLDDYEIDEKDIEDWK